MTTVGESVSRIRNILKSVKEDPFITDRFIFSIVNKYAKMVIRRQDNEGKIMRLLNLFKTIPCLELVEVDKVEACCTGIRTNCTIRRTKDRLDSLLEGSRGPIIRTVSSLDWSKIAIKTFPKIYTSIANSKDFKYNKNVYYWYLDGYIYLPNVEWEGILIEAIFQDEIDSFICSKSQSGECVRAQDLEIGVPDYLFAEIEQMAIKELLTTAKIPTDGPDDSQNILR